MATVVIGVPVSGPFKNEVYAEILTGHSYDAAVTEAAELKKTVFSGGQMIVLTTAQYQQLRDFCEGCEVSELDSNSLEV